MSDRLLNVGFSSQAQSAGTGIHRFKAPVGLTLVGATVGLKALTGTPTNVQFTVKNGAATLVAAASLTLTAAGTAEALTPHLGGSLANGDVAKGDTVTVDVGFTGGTTPTADYDVQLWFLSGTK